MFICRHVLLRAYIPRRFPTPLISRRLVSDSGSPFFPHKDAYTTQTLPNLHSEVMHQGGEEVVRAEPSSTSNAIGALTSGNSEHTEYHLPELSNKTAVPAEISTGMQRHFANDPLAAYVTYRQQGLSMSTNFSLAYFSTIVRTAARERRADIVRYLVEDVLEAGDLPGAERVKITQQLLHLVGTGLVQNSQVLSLLQALQSSGQLMSIPKNSRIPLTRAIISRPPSAKIDPQLMDLLASLLLPLIVDPKNRPSSFGLKRSLYAVSMLYQFVHEFAKSDERHRALDIMRTLVETNNLSSEAIHTTDLASGDFRHIVLAALVRSCLQWRWFKTANRLMLNALSSVEVISPALGELAVHVSWTILENSAMRELTASAAMIVQLMERAPIYTIPVAFMDRLYNVFAQGKQANLIETVYALSQSANVAKNHCYLPPRGATLMWFMRYLTTKSRNVHLARQVAMQVVQHEVPILIQDRGKFIALVASQGFAGPARALWEQYSSGKDRDVVVGNASTMLRVVHLFVNLDKRKSARRWPHERDQSTAKSDREDADLSRTEDGSGSSPLADPRQADSELEASTADAGFATESSEQGRMHEVVYDINHVHDQIVLDVRCSEGRTSREAADGSLPLGIDYSPIGSHNEREGEHSNVAATSDTISEFRAFAERVFEAFRENLNNIAQAHHFQLNAMARGSFMLGKLDLGFKTIRKMLDRRFIPDLHDVNVALSSLAECKPRAAAKVIARMVKVGLQPDAVTFGIVIHHALIHRDMSLASSLQQRARQLNCSQLSYKTVGALLRAHVMRRDDEVPASARLEDAKKLLDSLLKANQVPSPNMGRASVIIALRADNPVMAFKFWRMFIKDKVEWKDDLETRTRKMIANPIRQLCATGRLKEDKGRVMLSELGERTTFGSRPHSGPSTTSSQRGENTQ
ncbi:hypothetical protein AcV5_007411 [Taiwanofungus camphoratus]|nr:hypothetical protein AcV5_007411 [Antrodia cinnamomea]